MNIYLFLQSRRTHQNVFQTQARQIGDTELPLLVNPMLKVSVDFDILRMLQVLYNVIKFLPRYYIRFLTIQQSLKQQLHLLFVRRIF